MLRSLLGPFSDSWTEADVETVVARGNPADPLYVPIVVGINADCCDREWAERLCMELASHPHFTVRGNAILGFGYIARTCRALNEEQVVPIISRALDDPHEFVRGHANSAARDLQVFLGVLVPGYDTEKTEALYEAMLEVQLKNTS